MAKWTEVEEEEEDGWEGHKEKKKGIWSNGEAIFAT